MEKITSELPPITPIDAISDAMMRTYWQQIEYKMKRSDKKINDILTKEKDPTKLFEVASRGQCYTSSVETVINLTQRNSQLFKSLFLVSSEVIKSTSQFDRAHYHTYFVGEAKDGFWYAASPANHNVKEDKEYATAIVREQNLETLIETISKRDKIAFPDAQTISEALKENSYSIPQMAGHHMRILDVRQLSQNHVFSEIKKESSYFKY